MTEAVPRARYRAAWPARALRENSFKQTGWPVCQTRPNNAFAGIDGMERK